MERMPPGLTRTFDLLAQTPNDAAVGVLLRAFESSNRDAADLALKAALQRRSRPLSLEVLRRWHTLGDHARLLVREKQDWLHGAIRTALVSYEEQFYRNGCDAMLVTHEYELAPVLVAAAEDPANPFGDLAAETALLLAEQLYDELHAPRDYRNRRDPATLSAFFVSALEAAVGNFTRHGRRELIEAFLLLAGKENALLRHLLLHPQAKVSAILSELLTASPRPAIIRLLLQLLEDPRAPLPAVKLVGKRKDLTFLRQLFRKLAEPPAGGILQNLKRIDAIVWLPSATTLLPSLVEAEQTGAVHFVANSRTPAERLCEYLDACFLHGLPGARRAAAAALAHCKDIRVPRLIERGLEDEDVGVRANLIALIRPCNLPHALERLVALLTAREETIRNAARRALVEFEFAPYLAAFDNLDAAARRNTGRIVRQVDPTVREGTLEELRNDARARRRRGLEVAVALGLVNDLAEDIGRLLQDEDPYLRLETVQTLATENTPTTSRLLRDALFDSHALVHQAAEEALLARAIGGAPAGGTTPGAALGTITPHF
jgi:HEAT repeat protein